MAGVEKDHVGGSVGLLLGFLNGGDRYCRMYDRLFVEGSIFVNN